MKVNLINNNVIDTDNLDDRSAEIHEAVNSLYNACERYNVVGFVKVILKDNEGLGALFLPNKTDEIRNRAYLKLVASISDWLEKTSDGRLSVVDNAAEETDNP